MKTRILFLALLCATFLGIAGAEEPRPFEIVGLDDRPALAEQVYKAAVTARRTIRDEVDVDWQGTLLIVWANDDLFREKTGFHPENTAAAASPSRMTIWINESAWSRSAPAERQRTMTHEMGHILLGALPGGPFLPLWANEGIVMHLADQWGYDRQIQLLTAHLFGQLPDLRSLESEFPRSGESTQLVYNMSYAAVETVAYANGDRPGEVRRLVRQLADPENGPRLAREFSDAYRVEGWQLATQHSLGSRLSTGIVVLTGTGSIFLAIAVLFIIAYIRMRFRRRARDEQYVEESEAWEQSLTDEDVQDIYGDREERWD